MSDLINRRAVIDTVEGLKKYSDVKKLDFEIIGYNVALNDAKEAIRSLPSAEPERKKGKWIYYPKASGSVTSTVVHLYPVCSECGCEHPITNYCPNCGADMRGDGDADK